MASLFVGLTGLTTMHAQGSLFDRNSQHRSAHVAIQWMLVALFRKKNKLFKFTRGQN
jgi:hypothetical protein